MAVESDSMNQGPSSCTKCGGPIKKQVTLWPNAVFIQSPDWPLKTRYQNYRAIKKIKAESTVLLYRTNVFEKTHPVARPVPEWVIVSPSLRVLSA